MSQLPPPDMGQGQSGVPQGGALESDLANLSDSAKRVAATRQAAVQGNAQQNLQRVQQGKPAKSLNDMIADHVMAQTEPSPETNPNAYITNVANRIGDLEKQQAAAKKVKNIKAVQTYDQVIGILRQRMLGVQNKLAAQMTAAPGAASQPAEGQQ